MRSFTAISLSRIVLWGVLLTLVGMGVCAKRGWLDLGRIARRNSELNQEIDHAVREKQSLERQVEALQSDPAEQERIIRRVLGYARPEETVIEF